MGNGALVRRVTVDEGVSGADRIHLLFKAKGDTASAWADRNALLRSQVSMCIQNRRAYSRIRDRLADYLGRPRATIDALIEGRADDSAE